MNHPVRPADSDQRTRNGGSLVREPLPDIAVETSAVVNGRLDRVGMTGVEVIVRTTTPDGQSVLVPALADAFVSLDDTDAKGIHMSRLLLVLQDELQHEMVTPKLVRQVLNRFLETHYGLSQFAQLRLNYTHICQRESLTSDHKGWRHYPVTVAAESTKGQVRFWLEVAVVYSSTCPCSAALARQIMQQKFQTDFSHHRWLNIAQVNDWLRNHGTIATPHSQRSVAQATVELRPGTDEFPITRLIDTMEDALSTAVQSVVKRSDEQEFARASGSNLMFCEDAARLLRRALDSVTEVIDYRVQASHYESLHPHDAVAIVVKGIEGGLRP
jgi:GTP cyclohydrolase I